MDIQTTHIEFMVNEKPVKFLLLSESIEFPTDDEFTDEELNKVMMYKQDIIEFLNKNKYRDTN